MELVKVGEKTYYIKNNTNIGIYKIDENSIYLIDTGNDKDMGKKILKIVSENNWQVKGIINTHSNADHIGGNKYIQDKTNCPIFSFGVENCFIKYPFLESSFLYGGYPFKDLKNKFLEAKESNATDIDGNLPVGLEYVPLKGHFFDMIGIKTRDDVLFLGDALFSEETINKYHVFFIYDVKEYLNTLEFLSNLNAKLFIPSHGIVTNDISNLININKNKIKEIIEFLNNVCINEITFDDILKMVFDKYNLIMNANQYVLVGSTIRSYLSYMYNLDLITYIFNDNKMYWKQVEVNDNESNNNLW